MMKNGWTIVGCGVLAAGAWISGVIAGSALEEGRWLKQLLKAQTNGIEKTGETKEQEEA